MKKMILLLVILVSLAIIFSGCSGHPQPKDEQGKVEQEESQEGSTAPDDGSLEGSQGEDPESDEIKTDTGRYQGQADSNFIEIKISGVPDAVAAKVFMLSEEIKGEFDQLELKKDDEIRFSYFKDQNEQLVIVEIKKMTTTISE